MLSFLATFLFLGISVEVILYEFLSFILEVLDSKPFGIVLIALSILLIVNVIEIRSFNKNFLFFSFLPIQASTLPFQSSRSLDRSPLGPSLNLVGLETTLILASSIHLYHFIGSLLNNSQIVHHIGFSYTLRAY